MKNKIDFFFLEQQYFLSKNEKNYIDIWVKHVIRSYNFNFNFLNIIFCSDKALHKKNIQYLNHNTLTDVITFDLADEEKTISGEIYISSDRIKENAKIFHCTVQEEMLRVIIHGVLHLLGYKDKHEAEKKIMKKKEEEYLILWKALLQKRLK